MGKTYRHTPTKFREDYDEVFEMPEADYDQHEFRQTKRTREQKQVDRMLHDDQYAANTELRNEETDE